MGWNQGFAIFEETIVAIYDLGRLDKEVLSAVMEPYRGTDIDCGGSNDLRSKDGKSVEQIVVECFGGSWPGIEKGYKAFLEITDTFGWC